MTFYLPNTDVIPIGSEPAEFIDPDPADPQGRQISKAQKAGSRIVKIDAPHLSMLTDAQAITDVIVEAASGS